MKKKIFPDPLLATLAPWRFLSLFVFASSLLAGNVFAQSVDAGTGETDALVTTLDHDLVEAQTSDCSKACKALDSMRRATERLCTLEPGTRCSQAQEKVKKAADRIREACPECSAGLVTTNPTEQPKGPPPAPPEPGREEVEVKSGRGCAGCTIGSPADDAAPFAILAGLALLAARRRSRCRR